MDEEGIIKECISQTNTSDSFKKRKEKVVMVSGCFDPLHLGHLLSFQAAKALGDKLIVVIDSDEYTTSKKGAVFMPIEDRVAIIKELRCVDDVIVMGKGDISDAILHVKPDILANGGDVDSIERFTKGEIEACEKVGCQLVFNIGGGKIRASSELLKRWVKNHCDQN